MYVLNPPTSGKSRCSLLTYVWRLTLQDLLPTSALPLRTCDHQEHSGSFKILLISVSAELMVVHIWMGIRGCIFDSSVQGMNTAHPDTFMVTLNPWNMNRCTVQGIWLIIVIWGSYIFCDVILNTELVNTQPVLGPWGNTWFGSCKPLAGHHIFSTDQCRTLFDVSFL